MDYTVESVDTYWPTPHTECWAILMARPDGSKHAYVFPKYTLEQRAAEYGLDPGDVEGLLDIVLHEQFVHAPGGPGTQDAAARQGMLSPALMNSGTARKGDMVPTDLFNAPTIEQARDAHLARVEHAKQTRGRVRPPAKGRDPLDVIRAEHGVTAAGVAARARTVNLHRRAMRGQLTKTEAQELARATRGEHHA
ncbi:hypothetical protein [Streptomyces sp. NRRL S-813]|uniref:hypothetical protein n=1 Tax=Streptomyces sp. NRRL S-813 TaxID=1463919 RepID=UPI0004C0B2B1|nr:hypothetical protein [Streptomyces sp. NRRL S-813]